ncbi:MAG: alpha-amylase family glycosyl hydrolase [Candidatus Latescibacterota bacterium]
MIEKSDDPVWWKKGVIYHVYPLSFMDSDGNGRGDLNGIRSRLDYLQWLGVDALWLSPIYPSPMVDFGYDVSDYTGIHPLFGTMEDFDRFLAEAHARGLKVVLDFVPNHTSDEHPWFRESRSSRDNPKRDWYYWRDPAPGGGPPNNWLIDFGGSAWEFDETTGQYYYHAFLKQEPDLNWRNPGVREAISGVMQFWLDKGVDGFRVDVMWHLMKDKYLRDNPPNPDYHEGMPPQNRLVPAFSSNQQEVHDAVAGMRKVMDRYRERLLIGEVYLSVEGLASYYGPQADGAHLPSNFLLIEEKWDAPRINLGVCRYEGALPPDAWPNWAIGNHDKSRVASRIGPGQARVAALLLMTLRGTPTVYYGDEIGMGDTPIPPEKTRDPSGQHKDKQRTPMQWSAETNAGFTTGVPWLPVGRDCRRTNVESERDDPASMLSLYRRLIDFHRRERAIHGGVWRPVDLQGDIFTFLREDDRTGRRFLVAANLGHKPGIFTLPDRWKLHGEVIISTIPEREGRIIGKKIELSGDEGMVVAVNPRYEYSINP